MSRRASLASLLDAPSAPAQRASAPAEATPAPAPAPARDEPPARKPQSRPRHPRTSDPSPPRTRPRETEPDLIREGPRYLQLERKELRVRADQADQLAALTRRLNRARRGSGERITDNTLIRVAIDILLRDADRLRGVSEGELRQSLTP